MSIVNSCGGFVSSIPILKFKKLHPDAIIPEYKHEGDSGMDLCALEGGGLMPGQVAIIRTGLSIELPSEGFEAQIRSRSGLAAKHGIAVLNSPGTVDASYRGELKVILINHDKVTPFSWWPGDRIAQLVIARVAKVAVQVVEELSYTDRGDGGLGSTGVK